MATQWYYAHDEKKLGPFSQQELKELAAAGTLLPIDTVWQEGVEQGVEAHRVKNLFPRPALTSTEEIDHVLAEEAASPPAETPPPEKVEIPKTPPKSVPKPAKKGRAIAVKGCDIVSQDGSYRFPSLQPNIDYEVYAQYNGRKSDNKTVSQFDDRPQVSINLKIDTK